MVKVSRVGSSAMSSSVISMGASQPAEFISPTHDQSTSKMSAAACPPAAAMDTLSRMSSQDTSVTLTLQPVSSSNLARSSSPGLPQSGTIMVSSTPERSGRASPSASAASASVSASVSASAFVSAASVSAAVVAAAVVVSAVSLPPQAARDMAATAARLSNAVFFMIFESSFSPSGDVY